MGTSLAKTVLMPFAKKLSKLFNACRNYSLPNLARFETPDRICMLSGISYSWLFLCALARLSGRQEGQRSCKQDITSAVRNPDKVLLYEIFNGLSLNCSDLRKNRPVFRTDSRCNSFSGILCLSR